MHGTGPDMPYLPVLTNLTNRKELAIIINNDSNHDANQQELIKRKKKKERKKKEKMDLLDGTS